MQLLQKLAERLERMSQHGLMRHNSWWFLATAVILLFSCMGIATYSLQYAVSMDEFLWNDISNQYDKNGDARFNMEELMAVLFNTSTNVACPADSICIPRERVRQWMIGMDDECDGVDGDEMLQMFQQLPSLLLPASSRKQLQWLLSLSRYRRMGPLIVLLFLVLLTLLTILFISNVVTREAQLVQQAKFFQQWQKSCSAMKLERLEKKHVTLVQLAKAFRHWQKAWERASSAIKLKRLEANALNIEAQLFQAKVFRNWQKLCSIMKLERSERHAVTREAQLAQHAVAVQHWQKQKALTASKLARLEQHVVSREAQLFQAKVFRHWQTLCSAMKLERSEQVVQRAKVVHYWQKAFNDIKVEKLRKDHDLLAAQNKTSHTVQKIQRAVRNHFKRKAEHTTRRLIMTNAEMVRIHEEKQKALNQLERLHKLTQDSACALTRKVHFLFASPLVSPQSGQRVPCHALKVEEEFHNLQRALRTRGCGALELHAELATKKNLTTLLQSNEPSCWHISCHGKDECISLEDESSCEESFSAANLRDVMKTPQSSNLEVAVLMCCSSQGFGRALLDVGFHNVVCTCGAVLDRSARCFTEAFWTKLSHPEVSVKAAFDAALASLRASFDSSEVALFKLLQKEEKEGLAPPHRLRQCSAPDPVLSAPLAPLLLRRQSSSPEGLSDLHCKLEDFVGREKECSHLLEIFGGRRVACLYGEHGIGKTATLEFFASHASSQGRRFSNGVLLPSCSSERLVLRCLDAVWRKLGRCSVWEQQDDVPEEVLEEYLCEELNKLERECWEQPSSSKDAKSSLLLVVDNADSLSPEERSLLLKVLNKTKSRILLTAKRPWDRDIGTCQVRNVELRGLDQESSAKLFWKRIRRTLHPNDFVGVSLPKLRDQAGNPLNPSRYQILALQCHPLVRALAGNPGQIRKIAAQVVTGLPSLNDLLDSTIPRPPTQPLPPFSFPSNSTTLPPAYQQGECVAVAAAAAVAASAASAAAAGISLARFE